MKHFEYPSIEQFRNTIVDINRNNYTSLDENNIPILDLIQPIIDFEGTVKLHGTNSSVVMENNQIYTQSRNRVITPQSDNDGFSNWVHTIEKQQIFTNIFKEIKSKNNISDKSTIVIYGEWVGQGIQKNVAVSKLPKSFFIFDIRVINEEKDLWIDSKNYSNSEYRIYNIFDYTTYNIRIDFNKPHEAQNTLIEITNEVEKECPVGKAFGISDVGEGVVWKAFHNGKRYIFKVKGEKHSVSKVKTLANVDVEKINNVIHFCDYVVTINRLDQAIKNICGNEIPTIHKTGEIVKWMTNDIFKEEYDTIIKNQLNEKDIKKYLGQKVSQLFNQKLNKQCGLN